MRDIQPVSRRWAWGVAIAVMAGVVLGYLERPLPQRLMQLLAGSSGVEQWGGLRATVRSADKAPPGSEPPGASPPRTFTVELPGLDASAAQAALAMLGEPLTFRAVIEDGALLGDDALLSAIVEPFVAPSVDQWTADIGGVRRRALVLEGRERAALERTFAAATARGWNEKGAVFLGYENLDHLDAGAGAPGWRAYALGEPLLDRQAVASARVIESPYSHQASVQLTLTGEGTARFCQISEQLTAHKLAIVTGHRVWSAPILNGPICGGKLSILFRDRDPQSQAAALVAVLAAPELAPGAVVAEHRIFPARPMGGRLWLGRLLAGALIGLSAGLAMWLLLIHGQPSWRRGSAPTSGPFPWRRLAFTASAPLATIALAWVPLPGISIPEGEGLTIGLSLGMLGLTPLLASFVLVEVVAVAVPSLRSRRHQANRRAPLTFAAIALGMLLSALQGYFLARYFEGQDLGDAGWRFRITTILSAAAATALYAWIAPVASARGLGNGYGTILATIALLEWIVDGAGQLSWSALPDGLALLAIAALTALVLRWQTASADGRRAPLQAPVTGDAPLSSLPSLTTGLALFAAAGLLQSITPLGDWLRAREQDPIWLVGFAVLSTPLWAWLWARPQLLDRGTGKTGLLPPSLEDWRRAVIVAAGFSFAMALLHVALSSPPRLLEGAAMSYLTAVVIDLFSDGHAYRGRWVPVLVLHQVQRAALVEEAMWRAGIEGHLQGRALRTLLAFFGPFAPITVLVPEAKEEAARALLTGMEELVPAAARPGVTGSR